MSFAIIQDGAPVELFPGVSFEDPNGILHPGNWLEHATPEERADAQVLDIVEPPPAPEGKQAVTTGLVLTDGVPTRTYELADQVALPSERVPLSVSSAQACLILDDDRLLDQVEAIVAQMPKAVQIWFARANDWERANPYVAGIGLELDLTDDALDEMFRRAARRL